MEQQEPGPSKSDDDGRHFNRLATRLLSVRHVLSRRGSEIDQDEYSSLTPNKRRKLLDHPEFGLTESNRGGNREQLEETKEESESHLDLAYQEKTEEEEKVTAEDADREVKKLLWSMNLIGRLQHQYSDWEWKYLTTRTTDYNFFIHVSIVLLPILFIFSIWDILAGTVLQIPQLAWVQHYGVLMPIHCLCLPLVLYGYVMRQTHANQPRLSRVALSGLILHPTLFVLHCSTDVIFNYCRYEAGLYYERYLDGLHLKPDDYDPDHDYGPLERRRTYNLELEY